MSRKKSCDYCDDWSQSAVDGKNGHQLIVEIYPENGVISITSFVLDENEETEELIAALELNYCPKCGRKLT